MFALPQTYSKLCICCKDFPVVRAHVGSTPDTKMDTTDGNNTEGMKMETENEQTVDNDCCSSLSDKTHQHLLISDRPSSSCRLVRLRSRPSLQSTKSFPPYSHCIGGLGEDEDSDDEHNSDMACHPYVTHVKEDRQEELRGTERKEELTARCAREGVKAKWRLRRKERLWGSFEVETDSWERGRCSGKRRVEETEKEEQFGDDEEEEATNAEGKHWRCRNSSFEKVRKEEEEDKDERSTISEVEDNKNSGETLQGNDKEAAEVPGMTGGSATQQWASPHPLLSKLLHSSTSSSSSINLSSAESDEVFSEGEDAGSKRKTFRKVRIAGKNK